MGKLDFVEKIFEVQDVPKDNPCLNCGNCLRLKLLELGLVSGQKVKIKKMRDKLWTLTFLDNFGNSESTFGLREDELKRIIFKDDCVIGFNQYL